MMMFKMTVTLIGVPNLTRVQALHPYSRTNHDRDDRSGENLDPEGIRVAVRYRHLFGGLNLHLTKRIKNICVKNNPCVWQKNYYESIVSNEEKLNNIRRYILNNPQKWDDDPENPSHQSLELLIELVF